VGFETQDGGLAPYKGKKHISQISKKKNIWKKGFSALFLNHYKVMKLFYYNEKLEIFLHEKIYFLLNQIFFYKKGTIQQRVK